MQTAAATAELITLGEREGNASAMASAFALRATLLQLSGRLGAAQRAALSEMLAATKAEGLARVVFLHHPPHVGGARIAIGGNDHRAVGDDLRQHDLERGHRHDQQMLDGAALALADQRGAGEDDRQRRDVVDHLHHRGEPGRIVFRCGFLDAFGDLVHGHGEVLGRAAVHVEPKRLGAHTVGGYTVGFLYFVAALYFDERLLVGRACVIHANDAGCSVEVGNLVGHLA